MVPLVICSLLIDVFATLNSLFLFFLADIQLAQVASAANYLWLFFELYYADTLLFLST